MLFKSVLRYVLRNYNTLYILQKKKKKITIPNIYLNKFCIFKYEYRSKNKTYRRDKESKIRSNT